VGSIIGKKGDYVRQIREQSGAKVNISDGSCPERWAQKEVNGHYYSYIDCRIVTISGTAGAIDHAFTMITRKFEDVRGKKTRRCAEENIFRSRTCKHSRRRQ
jgi:poly(rC)-binding protein 3/4